MKRSFSVSFVLCILLLAAYVVLLAWFRESTAPRRDAQRIWRENEEVILEAGMGKRGSVSEFQDACYFFYKLTGINVPANYSSYLGARFPNKDTATALEPLHHWYAENKDRLYWDEERNEVRLAPASD